MTILSCGSALPGVRRILARAALAALLLAAGALGHSVSADEASTPTISTATGPVSGIVKGGVNEFLGIRYAAPPVGDLRWKPPQAPAAWSQTLQATKFGNTCPQITELGVFAGPVSTTEDCLFLNVFTTKLGEAAKAPVLLWIHGGGLFDGESNDYDASKLAKGGPSGPTVVVTINYRLGLFGYFGHPAIDAEGHNFGNYGLMDQQAALRWIKQNIAAFGGDPDNVTVGGQSAGSTSTAAAVISPLSKGLFERAIFQSGPLLTVAPVSLAETYGSQFADAAHCGTGKDAAAASCLRGLTVQQILALQGTASGNGPYVTGLIVDGTVLPVAADTAWSTGQFNHMPIMNGTVRDEGAFTASINELFFGPLTASQFQGFMTKTYDGPAGASFGPPNYPMGTTAAVLKQYPASDFPSASVAYVAALTDPMACRARHLNQALAGQVPLWAYEFDVRDAPWYFPPLSFPSGAAHTIDIQFLFPGWSGGPLGRSHPLSQAEQRLSDELVAAWTNFMYSGNPNGKGNAPWPQYAKGNEVYFSQNLPNSSTKAEAVFADQHKCAFWDGVLVY